VPTRITTGIRNTEPREPQTMTITHADRVAAAASLYCIANVMGMNRGMSWHLRPITGRVKRQSTTAL
jgi:hypothetical protein